MTGDPGNPANMPYLESRSQYAMQSEDKDFRMNFSETFVRRPIATCLLMLAIAMFGVLSYRALPVSDLPQVDSPTIQVSAQLPGGSPETMASSVTAVLERQFTTIAGLDSMISSSNLGGIITLQFDMNRDMTAPRWMCKRRLPRHFPCCLPCQHPPHSER
jgi:Cu/Ag efflux pump CusA